MKITKAALKQIIKEETEKLLMEEAGYPITQELVDDVPDEQLPTTMSLLLDPGAAEVYTPGTDAATHIQQPDYLEKTVPVQPTPLTIPAQPPQETVPPEPAQETVPVQPTQQTPFFSIQNRGGSPNAYWSLHSNERVAREALAQGAPMGKHVQSSAEGRHMRVAGLKFDPNRLFTPEGGRKYVEKRMRRAGPRSRAKAEAVLSNIRDQELDQMLPEEGGAIISAHNSRASARYPGGKSLYQHEKGKPITAEFHEGDPKDLIDFIIITNKADFDRAVAENIPFNALYQPWREGQVDDGSGSVFAGQAGIPYFNPEVRIRKGALPKQLAMLRWINSRPKTEWTSGSY